MYLDAVKEIRVAPQAGCASACASPVRLNAALRLTELSGVPLGASIQVDVEVVQNAQHETQLKRTNDGSGEPCLGS